jgi:hypothetical protein
VFEATGLHNGVDGFEGFDVIGSGACFNWFGEDHVAVIIVYEKEVDIASHPVWSVEMRPEIGSQEANIW